MLKSHPDSSEMGLGHIPPRVFYVLVEHTTRTCSHTDVAACARQGWCESGQRALCPEDDILSGYWWERLLVPGQESQVVFLWPLNGPLGADLGPLKPLDQPGADAVQRRLRELGTASEERGKPCGAQEPALACGRPA